MFSPSELVKITSFGKMLVSIVGTVTSAFVISVTAGKSIPVIVL